MASGLEQLATYADAQLDHVMKEMLGKIFVEQPDNPVGFMIKFLKDYDNDSLLQASRDDCEPAQQEGEMPTMQVERPGGNASGGRRRVGVSAEPVNMQKLADQKHRIIPKSDQDREHIRAAVKNNFLFSSLDDEQMSIVRAPADLLAHERSDTHHRVEKTHNTCYVPYSRYWMQWPKRSTRRVTTSSSRATPMETSSTCSGRARANATS